MITIFHDDVAHALQFSKTLKFSQIHKKNSRILFYKDKDLYIKLQKDNCTKRHTKIVIESDAKALDHYELTTTLLIDHDPHDLTKALMV